MKRLLAALSVLLALAFAFPLTLQDDLGRTVTLQAPPKRIVTMLPSVTETVCALGACDRIVATDDYSDWPESVKRLPKAGGLYNPNPELIVSLKPDLVLVSKYGRLYETLERAGLTVYAVRTETYEDIFKTVRTLGRLLGLEAEAERLARAASAAEARVAELEAAFPDLDLVLVESGGDNLAASFSPELVDLCIYVIDVAAGDKIPRKGGPGITRSDLLVINKIDLAPMVGASLEVMQRDTERMRPGRPWCFTNLQSGKGLDQVERFLLNQLPR